MVSGGALAPKLRSIVNQPAPKPTIDAVGLMGNISSLDQFGTFTSLFDPYPVTKSPEIARARYEAAIDSLRSGSPLESRTVLRG